MSPDTFTALEVGQLRFSRIGAGLTRCGICGDVVTAKRCATCDRETLRRALAYWALFSWMAGGQADPDDHGPGCDGPYNCVCSDVPA